MALKPCLECGAKVSSSARFCPGCGNPRPSVSMAMKVLGTLVLFPIVFLVFLPVLVAVVVWSWQFLLGAHLR